MKMKDEQHGPKKRHIWSLNKASTKTPRRKKRKTTSHIKVMLLTFIKGEKI